MPVLISVHRCERVLSHLLSEVFRMKFSTMAIELCGR
jgi:hypothetical protein